MQNRFRCEPTSSLTTDYDYTVQPFSPLCTTRSEILLVQVRASNSTGLKSSPAAQMFWACCGCATKPPRTKIQVHLLFRWGLFICICIYVYVYLYIYICISVNIYIYTRDGDLYTCNITTFFSALSIGRLLYPTSSPLCSIKLNGKEYGTWSAKERVHKR